VRQRREGVKASRCKQRGAKRDKRYKISGKAGPLRLPTQISFRDTSLN
jgi:hypothetical protein